MRSVTFRNYGGPEVLELSERPMPVAKAGEVVVRVVASTVNPTDMLMRSGKQAALMSALHPPFIAGMEFAGYVHQLGDGSPTLKVGQPVMGLVNPRRPEGGAHTEYLCLPAASIVPLPEGTDLVEACTIPMNGLTAKMALEMLDLRTGASLLVTGGAGAVGGYVIQLAKQAGLHTIAQGKDSDRALLLGLGASEVVPRGDGMVSAVRETHPEGVDALLDCALVGDPAAALVRDAGAVVSLRRSNVITDQRLKCGYVGVLEQASNTAALQWLVARFVDKTLTPRVAARLPFTEAAAAHRMVEQGGLRGRVVLMPFIDH